MATVPIVTEVTYAQLETLISNSGLNEGLQYKVTDKDWLLLATSVNTLKAATGTLLKLNDAALPDYIDCDFLYIDTGIVSGELYDNGYTLLVDGNKYVAFSGEISIISTPDGEVNYRYAGIMFGSPDMLAGDKYGTVFSQVNSSLYGTSIQKINQAWDINLDSFRAMIGYYKSKF